MDSTRPRAETPADARFIVAVVFVLLLAGCSPQPADDGTADPPPAANANDSAADVETAVSELDRLLLRLGEPSMAGQCDPEVTTYRLVRLDWQQHAAAVRVFAGADDRGYRSVFSRVPDETISRDSYVSETAWAQIDAEFRIKDFWNLDPADFGPGGDRGVMFLEACKEGEYHWLEGEPGETWLNTLEDRLARTGQLEWLAGGSRNYD